MNKYQFMCCSCCNTCIVMYAFLLFGYLACLIDMRFFKMFD